MATSNYGWPVPDYSDLPDGPAQIAALGVAADASLKNEADARLAIDGRVTTVENDVDAIQDFIPPQGSALSSAAQSIPNSTTTDIVLATDQIPLAGGMTRSGGVFTVPIAGLYLVVIKARWAANATGYRTLQLKRNNSFYAEAPIAMGQAQDSGAGISVVIKCAANDNLRMATWQNSGGALNVVTTSSGTSMAVCYLGPAAP